MSDNLYEKLSEKRKALQVAGLVPDWYTTGGFQLFSSKYEYETDGKSIKGQFERIAKTAAKHLIGTKYEAEAEAEFFNLFWKGWLSPSTPVLANMGTKRGFPVSCSGTYIDDSIDGFYSNLREVAMLTKYGFGTASYLGDIRPRGSDISIGGSASGILPVFKDHVNCMRNVAQGTSRRGSWAGYVEITHGDFDELADYVMEQPDDANVGWIIKDSFVADMDAGDEEALRRYQKAMKLKMVTGKGYFCFIDKANRNRPQMYVDKGMYVNAYQLCVAPETLVLTDSGYQQISELENETVSVWNGEEFSSVLVKKTGENQKLIKVKTNSGFELECTPYHKFYVLDETTNSLIETAAKDLRVGDKLEKCAFPIIEGSVEAPDMIGESDFLSDDFFVPIGDYTTDSKVKWLNELCHKYATVAINDEAQSIQISGIDLSPLLKTQLMLQTMGVTSDVAKTEGAHSLLIGNGGVVSLQNLGFTTHRLQLTDHVPNRECGQFVKITEVLDEGRFDDTFCFTEHKRHRGVFNGIITGQCNEITLFSDKDHTYSCVLSSMNVSKYDEWKDTKAVFWATIFLDCVAQEFIEMADGIQAFDKIVRFTKKGRSLGLGQCGFHTLLQNKRIPFEGFEAHMLSQDIAAHIFNESLVASKDMAIELGEPEWCVGYGVRNTHRIAIAPTKSTALLMGGVSEGINPDPAMTYTQLTPAGEIERITPALHSIMVERGVYNKKTIKNISEKMGSVQHVTWLSDDEKLVFKTAFEINQEAIVRMGSARGRYIDQWQSLNLFFSASESPARISAVHRMAFKDEKILGLYYIYSMAGVQASQGECVACQ
jgi:ribonucleoside-diphosphate reductase alpha chain